jgi:hypothetical protein
VGLTGAARLIRYRNKSGNFNDGPTITIDLFEPPQFPIFG